MLYRKLESQLVSHEIDPVIKTIDSLLLKKNISKKELIAFEALKMEVLIQENKLPEALKLSNRLLKNLKIISETTEVFLRIRKALIFEFFNEKEAGLLELAIVESIYNKRPKDIYYGQYLYRKSSFYLQLQPVLKSDSIALDLAEKAMIFGDVNNFRQVSGTARLLQSFQLDSASFVKREQLLMEALQDFKSLRINSDLSVVYLHLAKLSTEERNYENAKKYIDSGFNVAVKTDNIDLVNWSYKLKSRAYAEEHKIDSAFFYFKKFHDSDLEVNLKKQEKEVAQINFNNKIEKQKLESKTAKIRLQKSEDSNRMLLSFVVLFSFLIAIIIFLYRKLIKKTKDLDDQNVSLKKVIQQKEILLKELSHRVKNNLSLIISLIKFQSQEIPDSFYVEKFNYLEKRINAIAIAHEQFVYSDSEMQGGFYNLEEYLNKISTSLFSVSTKFIEYQQKVLKMNVSIDTALPIGILMNELINNSIKHAVSKDVLKINLSIEVIDEHILINYSDSGSVFKIDEHNNSLGLFIVDSMIEQLEGKLTRKDSTFRIVLKHKN